LCRRRSALRLLDFEDGGVILDDEVNATIVCWPAGRSAPASSYTPSSTPDTAQHVANLVEAMQVLEELDPS
ncbi:hypothetical protein EJB05_54932, partial [Eragrostis curvula]